MSREQSANMKKKWTCQNCRKKISAGFSLIEVMVAVAVFSMLMMMMSALFQQSNLAWRAGTDQVQGYGQLRSATAMLERDLANMVDIGFLADVGLVSTSAVMNAGSFTPPTSFFILRPSTSRGDKGQVVSVRGYSLVKWSLGGGSCQREETLFDAQGKKATVVTVTVQDEVNSHVTVSASRIELDSYFKAERSMVYQVTAELRANARNTYDIGAWSWGRKGTGQDPDDPESSVIRTWLGTQK